MFSEGPLLPIMGGPLPYLPNFSRSLKSQNSAKKLGERRLTTVP